MNQTVKSYILIHISVFLFGFTGILGQIISLPAIPLILWRCVLSSFLLFPVIKISKATIWPDQSNMLKFIGIGILLGLHWLCFYGSIKLANASVAMISLSMISVFTVFFEAIFNRTRLVIQDLVTGILVIPGVILINQSLSTDFKLGFWVGILCAVLSAMVAPLNKKYLKYSDPLTISWIEITVSAFLFALLTLILSASEYSIFCWPTRQDWIYLVMLASFCTVIPLSLALASMKSLSSFSTMLVFNLETVYGILLSIIILKEHKQLNLQFYLGVILILASVLAYPVVKASNFKYMKNSNII
ncbi:MAG: DMT family transporter [Saprospiraceae bacterium]